MENTQAASRAGTRPDAPLIGDIAHLGGRGALYLLALLKARQTRQHVAPTMEATITLLGVLDALGVIRVENHPSLASHTTYPDSLPWSYTWQQEPLDGLEDRLSHYLECNARNALLADAWIRVWQDLLSAEALAYLKHQLRLHQFSDAYLDDLSTTFAQHEPSYSLGHWRYACWAAVRSMASVSLQHQGNVELLKFTLRNELARRLQIASMSNEERFCFSPSYSLPSCALTMVFSTIATRLGDGFWRSPPAYKNILNRDEEHDLVETRYS